MGDVAPVIGPEGHQVTADGVPEQHAVDADQPKRAERCLGHQGPVLVGGNDDRTRQAKNLLIGRIAHPVEEVLAGVALGPGFGPRGRSDRRQILRIVVIEERIEERLEADSATRVGVGRHEDADVLARDQRHVGVKELGITAVTENPEAVARLFVESVGEAGEAIIMTLESRVHSPSGRVGQDPRVAQGSVPEMGQHEPGHIGGRGTDRAGRLRPDDDLPLLGNVVALVPLVSDRHVGRESIRKRLAGGGLIHGQRVEDVFLDVVIEAHTRYPLDDVAGDGGGVVGVRRKLQGRPDPGGQVSGQPRLHRALVGGIFGEEVAPILLESGRVGQDGLQGDRFGKGRRDLEVEVFVHIAAEIELALLDQLHDRRPGEQLRNRPDPEHRFGGIDRLLGRDVGVAVAFREEEGAAFDHRHRDTGDVLVPKPHGHGPIDERFDLGRVTKAASLGGRRPHQPAGYQQ